MKLPKMDMKREDIYIKRPNMYMTRPEIDIKRQ